MGDRIYSGLDSERASLVSSFALTQNEAKGQVAVLCAMRCLLSNQTIICGTHFVQTVLDFVRLFVSQTSTSGQSKATPAIPPTIFQPSITEAGGVYWAVMTSIKGKRKDLRPREKLQAKGKEALSDYELLMAIIGSGNAQADVSKIARNLLKVFTEKGTEITYDDVIAVLGIGAAKASEIMAAFEFMKRRLQPSERPIIDSPEKAVEQLADIRDKKQEHFVVMTLDGANRLIAKRIITIGTLTSSLVHPREVFADAITDRAANIIVAHNHPSESLDPSDADVRVTERLREAGDLVGIAVVDHIVITSKHHISIMGKS